MQRTQKNAYKNCLIFLSKKLILIKNIMQRTQKNGYKNFLIFLSTIPIFFDPKQYKI